MHGWKIPRGQSDQRYVRRYHRQLLIRYLFLPRLTRRPAQPLRMDFPVDQWDPDTFKSLESLLRRHAEQPKTSTLRQLVTGIDAVFPFLSSLTRLPAPSESDKTATHKSTSAARALLIRRHHHLLRTGLHRRRRFVRKSRPNRIYRHRSQPCGSDSIRRPSKTA